MQQDLALYQVRLYECWVTTQVHLSLGYASPPSRTSHSLLCRLKIDSLPTEGRTFDRCSQGGLIVGPWKLYYGPGGTAANESCQFCWWDGEHFPNASQPYANLTFDSFQCPNGGCLFNIIDDPTEHNEVSAEYPGPEHTMWMCVLENKCIFFDVQDQFVLTTTRCVQSCSRGTGKAPDTICGTSSDSLVVGGQPDLLWGRSLQQCGYEWGIRHSLSPAARNATVADVEVPTSKNARWHLTV